MKFNVRFIVVISFLIMFFSVVTPTFANPGPSFIEIIKRIISPFISNNIIGDEMLFIAKYNGNDSVVYQWEAYLLTKDEKFVKVIGPQTSLWIIKINTPALIKVTARSIKNPFDFDTAIIKVEPEKLLSLNISENTPDFKVVNQGLIR